MTLWGSRFSERPDYVLWDFTADPIDRRMLVDDYLRGRPFLKGSRLV